MFFYGKESSIFFITSAQIWGISEQRSWQAGDVRWSISYWLHVIAHLNLSDIPHNWRRCVDADSTWESSQDSFGGVIQSLVDVVNLLFLKKAAQQRGSHLLRLHKYFTSKNQDGKKAWWFQQIIYTQAVKHISDPPPDPVLYLQGKVQWKRKQEQADGLCRVCGCFSG